MRRNKAQVLSKLEAAREIFRVSILRGAATRALPKAYLLQFLNDSEVYSEFLKLCIEYDKSDDLAIYRKGLLMVVKKLGPSRIAKESGINRVTLYRMLSKGGNPSLKNLVALLRAIEMHFWVVDKGFLEVREETLKRNSDYPEWMPLSTIQRLRRRRG